MTKLSLERVADRIKTGLKKRPPVEGKSRGYRGMVRFLIYNVKSVYR